MIGATAFLAVKRPPSGVPFAPRATLWSQVDRIDPDGGAVAEVSLEPSPAPAPSVHAVARRFSEMGYDLDRVREGEAHVPTLFLSSLPHDLASISETDTRKRLFFQSVLPLILQVNREILVDRKRLWELRTEKQLKGSLPAEDRLWLAALAERYDVKRGDLDSLVARVDVVPPSLAMAQAAEESGWGTSRFARQGNAIFGQWTLSAEHGLTPRQRDDDKNHYVRRFSRLIDSVRAYALNLNTHPAYRKFRRARATLRHAGGVLKGTSLAKYLTAYSERGEKYVRAIRNMIRVNRLERLDRARLVGTFESAI